MSGQSPFAGTVCSNRRTMFVFSRLLKELRLDCTVKNGAKISPSFFFHRSTIFSPVNWSVFFFFFSLSTPAKQHLPWSYTISIHALFFFLFGSFSQCCTAVSRLQCFCFSHFILSSSFHRPHLSRGQSWSGSVFTFMLLLICEGKGFFFFFLEKVRIFKT